MVPRTVIAWFRRDLRLGDNPSLRAAVGSGARVVPLFVWDERLLAATTMGQRRFDRLTGAVVALDRDLRAIGGRLIVRRGDPIAVVPFLAAEAGAVAVHAAREHTPYARQRDTAVGRAVPLTLHDGTLLVEPERLGMTRVFGPFFRRWSGLVDARPESPPARINVPGDLSSERLPAVAPDGEPEARDRLAAFVHGRSTDYDRLRDRLDIPGTSRLGADLHLGTISAAQVYASVEATAFRRQLAWRDWAHHVLWFRPEARRLGWRDDLRGLAWRTDGEEAAAWRDGRTGYPVVDAAMRQLATEGWIHNRARMIAASFLTKDLLVDWRLGEAHFLRHLVDADVANNSLGWQWVAGVGTDAAPYHRIFNPVLQGERFDPAGQWVRCWVPELAGLPSTLVHRPWEAPSGPPTGYPPPIVDHRLARARALAWFADR